MTDTFTALAEHFITALTTGRPFDPSTTAIIETMREQGHTVSPAQIDAVRNRMQGGFYSGAADLAAQAAQLYDQRAGQVLETDPATLAQQAEDHARSGGTFRITGATE